MEGGCVEKLYRNVSGIITKWWNFNILQSRASVITKWDSSFVLQRGSSSITMQGRYYIVGQLLQSSTVQSIWRQANCLRESLRSRALVTIIRKNKSHLQHRRI